MNVEDAVGKLLHEPWREQPHVSRKADQIHLVFAESGHDFAIVILADLTFGRNH